MPAKKPRKKPAKKKARKTPKWSSALRTEFKRKKRALINEINAKAK